MLQIRYGEPHPMDRQARCKSAVGTAAALVVATTLDDTINGFPGINLRTPHAIIQLANCENGLAAGVRSHLQQRQQQKLLQQQQQQLLHLLQQPHTTHSCVTDFHLARAHTSWTWRPSSFCPSLESGPDHLCKPEDSVWITHSLAARPGQSTVFGRMKAGGAFFQGDAVFGLPCCTC